MVELSLGEDTLVALRCVQDKLLQVGGELNFPVSRGLLDSVKQSRQKYQNDLDHKKKIAEQEEVKKEKEMEELAQKTKKTKEQEKLKQFEDDIKKKEIGLKVTEDAIANGNKKLQEALTKKPVAQSILHSASSQIDMGLERKRKLTEEIEVLKRQCFEIQKSSS